MSRIIKINECGPFCPRFRPYGSISTQTQTVGIACAHDETSGHNFWLESPRLNIHDINKVDNEQCKKVFLTLKNAKVLE
jgi:hypothetical protein